MDSRQTPKTNNQFIPYPFHILHYILIAKLPIRKQIFREGEEVSNEHCR